MAERSTAAVDVADKSGGSGGEQKPPADEAEKATADGTTAQDSDDCDAADGVRTADTEGSGTQPAEEPTEESTEESPEPAPTAPPPSRAAQPPQPPELHSGHKLARRYRLEECVTRLDGFSSWRAVDEKLRRAVGVHLLAADHPRARPVLAAARSAALLGDPRFVQVLDAVEEDNLVYVVHEWLPDATSLATLLASGPLPTHEAYQLVSQIAQAMAAAHREGLSHLRLTPGCVLRTAAGQYRIRGLAVNAALRGITSDHPQRTDTEAIGALLYASLTRRWPYREDAYGLSGMAELTGDSLVPPDQVRAGVHRGLSELAMRALVNDGATASRQEQPCTTPEELTKAVAALPRIRPPEPDFAVPPPYQRPVRPQGGYGTPAARPPLAAGGPPAAVVPPAPPALPGRTGKALKWSVSALLIAALGLGSWQLADALMKGDASAPDPGRSPIAQQKAPQSDPTGKPVEISLAKDFDPFGSDGTENGDRVPAAVDGDPDTYWQTSRYANAKFGNLKNGVGLIIDLGEQQQVSSVRIDFVGDTSVDFLAASKNTADMPASLGDFSKVSSDSGSKVELKAEKPIRTQYILLWLTELPLTPEGNYRGRIAEVEVLS
ncbi:protein kinase family protein [Streptomyces sp. TRM 70361]|uniref:protein kinase family protein n=1 Tax=Streptomyces sp. TRM 70361 TaxID=3116553 RepID=UPI002E7ACE0C|nr:protein kinase family protein [Streptomyces sp. TRM 70361]MEE1939530.1 protein kinase family protein [Streptomyces sp. TRM 70361]